MLTLNRIYLALVVFILLISVALVDSQSPRPSVDKQVSPTSQCEESKNSQGTLKLIQNWKITNWSYESLLTDRKDVFTYLDPPYDIKDNLYGKKGSMHNGFNHDDFASDCDRYIGHQLVSYNSSNLVKERFDGWNAGEFDLTYTMRSVGEYMREQKDRKELLLYNYGIKGLA